MVLRPAIITRAARSTMANHRLSDANGSANVWTSAHVPRTSSGESNASDQGAPAETSRARADVRDPTCAHGSNAHHAACTGLARAPAVSPFRCGLRRGIWFSVLMFFLSNQLVPDRLGLFLGAAERLVRASRLAVCIIHHVRHPSPRNGRHSPFRERTSAFVGTARLTQYVSGSL